jgi:hypothetical protein
MNEPESILIRDLVARDRLDREEPDIRKLAGSIKRDGLFHPILIDSDLNVIDGLRRIRAAQSLGQDSIMAIQSHTFEDTCEYLTAMTDVMGTPPYWRVYEIYTTTNQQQKDRGSRMRKLRNRTDRTPGKRSREMFTEALQLGHEGVISATSAVCRAFYFPPDDASDHHLQGLTEIRDLLERNDVTLYEAKGMISRLDIPQGMTGDIVGKKEQHETLTRLLSQLAGFTKGVSKLGPLSTDFEKFELELLLRGFEDERRHLLRFIKQFRERISEQ